MNSILTNLQYLSIDNHFATISIAIINHKPMPNSKLILHSFLFSLGVVAYVFLVVLVMTHGDTLFGATNNLLGPLAILLLFTVSAAITGLLVFGRPIYLFLNGMKKEAITLALYTIGFLFLETTLVLFGLAIFK
jgi:hypothetical protein